MFMAIVSALGKQKILEMDAEERHIRFKTMCIVCPKFVYTVPKMCVLCDNSATLHLY